MSPATRILFIFFLTMTLLAAEEQQPIPVSVRPLAELLVYPGQSAPATVISLNNSRISAQIAAEIQTIPVQVGEKVQANQVLVELDCTDSRLALQNSRAALALAEKELSRARSLVKNKNVSAQQLQLRKTEYSQAQVAWKQARRQVEHCKVTAPFDGVITERLASEGELAAPGTPLLQILDTRRVEVSARIPADMAKNLEKASTLHLRADDQRWPLTLRTILPQIHSRTHTREARLAFVDTATLPGTAGRLVWRTGQPHLPADVLVQRDGKTGVFLLDGNKARFHVLKNAQIGHPAAADLPDDSIIIIDGRHALKDGDQVKPVH